METRFGANSQVPTARQKAQMRKGPSDPIWPTTPTRQPMTFEEFEARAKELFSEENAASMWVNLDEGDRAYWRTLAIEALEKRRNDKETTGDFDKLADRRLFWLDPDDFDAFAYSVDNSSAAGAALKAVMRRQPLWRK